MQQQLRLTDHERANLVAFLDGELEEEDAQGLETKIARSPSARKEVEALEKTWTMLEWLPRVEAPADFTDQTISRIHSQQMRAELIEGGLKRVVVIAAKVIGWVASVAAAVAIGFVGVRYAWPDPTRKLIEDLEIVENLEALREIPDIKFLDDVSRLGFFAPPSAPASGDPAAGQVPPGQVPAVEAPPAQPPAAATGK